MPCCTLVLLECTCPGEAPALGVVTSWLLITRHWCGDQVDEQALCAARCAQLCREWGEGQLPCAHGPRSGSRLKCHHPVTKARTESPSSAWGGRVGPVLLVKAVHSLL